MRLKTVSGCFGRNAFLCSSVGCCWLPLSFKIEDHDLLLYAQCTYAAAESVRFHIFCIPVLTTLLSRFLIGLSSTLRCSTSKLQLVHSRICPYLQSRVVVYSCLSATCRTLSRCASLFSRAMASFDRSSPCPLIGPISFGETVPPLLLHVQASDLPSFLP
ncbi:hypothetical protein PYCCODRAFT_262497 [Trametes coccinea BRFM310]|uniref:Uncharacterized protein n=1 Tax=Trametes coccinea (strain BRFM310) TaxID=1353009 RepID=A0A1Y2IQB8_TRAC3|nr:hypothetical protein PYCCODRAFT_262497 [Trametes coccinea BRFM310]